MFDRAGLPAAWLAALVVIVTLGSINGTVLSGSRLFATVGTMQPGYGLLAAGRTRRDAPLAALAVQALISLAFVVVIEARGTGAAGFDRIVAATSPVLWVVFLGAGVALMALRRVESEQPRPFRVPLYPWMPVVYLAACAFMLYESVLYAVAMWGPESWLTTGLLALGLPYWLVAGRDAASKRR
jgi:amino acid transporter